MSTLEEFAAGLKLLLPEERKKYEQDGVAATADMPWVPNPGSQSEAYFCEADEIAEGHGNIAVISTDGGNDCAIWKKQLTV